MPKVKRRRSIQRSALREIRKYQDKGKHATKNLVPKSCFNRLAREIGEKYNCLEKLRFREDAMSCLQEATESFITDLLRNANKIAAAQGRLTLQNVDLKLARSILTNTNDDFSSYLNAKSAGGAKKSKKSTAVAPAGESVSSEDGSTDEEYDDADDADEEGDGYVVV